MARPTKYREHFVEEVDKYIEMTGRENTSLPTKMGLALHLEVDEDTLNNWANKKDKEGKLVNPKFFGALKKLISTQGQQLIDDGIYGGKEVNSTIVKLLLQNNHGMKERRDVTTADKPIPLLGGSSVPGNNSNK